MKQHSILHKFTTCSSVFLSCWAVPAGDSWDTGRVLLAFFAIPGFFPEIRCGIRPQIAWLLVDDSLGRRIARKLPGNSWQQFKQEID